MSRPNIASSSRSHVVKEYTPLDKIKDPRLDQLVGKRQGKEIAVSKDTFDMMTKAHAILLKTAHETFPDGPGNQKTSVLTSGGRSWARLMDGRAEPVSTYAEMVKTIKEYGGGACGEHLHMTELEMKQVHRSQPVFTVSESNMDHVYMIIGDWRDKSAGDNAIVLDAWQGIKKIHTYGERINTAAPNVDGTIPAGEPIPVLPSVKKAMQAEMQSNGYMDARLILRIGLKAGPEAAEVALSRLEASNSLWDSITSTNDVYTYYKDPDGRTSAFNDTPVDYIRNYLGARAELQHLEVGEVQEQSDTQQQTSKKGGSDECCTVM